MSSCTQPKIHKTEDVACTRVNSEAYVVLLSPVPTPPPPAPPQMGNTLNLHFHWSLVKGDLMFMLALLRRMVQTTKQASERFARHGSGPSLGFQIMPRV